MSAGTLAVAALFSHMGDVTDLHLDGEVVWVASSGGVQVFDVDGRPLARLDDLPGRRATSVGWVNDELVIGTLSGAVQWSGQDWRAIGPKLPVIAVTSQDVVYRDGAQWSSETANERFVEAVEWNGQPWAFTADGRAFGPDGVVQLPGPVSDVAVVGNELRIALFVSAMIWNEEGSIVLPIPATAAGPVWGTSDGVVLNDVGSRVGGVPGAIDEVRILGSQIILGTDNGVWSIGEETQNWSEPGICDNFITGITRHQGDLVVSTFNGGACRYDGQVWHPLDLPSTMANDVLSSGDDLWVATAEGLVQVGKAVFTQVGPDQPRDTPATNHNGVNALSIGADGLWVADVLGPVQVAPWQRYRWHVSGRSYQAIAACPTGEVWVGSEDDGLAVRGASIGSRNGRSDWHHVGRLDGLPENWVMAVACAGPGSAYVGTYRSGVGLVDESGWTPIMEDAWVQFLLVDGEDLWIGTADGLFLKTDEEIQAVLDEDVHALFREDDRLWVGTRSGLIEVALH